MAKQQAIENVVTKNDLIKAFKEVGVTSSMILEVHCNMDCLPFVVGGAQTVVDALLELIQDTGTILMPLEPEHTLDPTTWKDPLLAPELYEDVRESVPAFHPLNCESAGKEVLDNFRKRDGVVFSSHPKCGYVAYGRYAKLLCNRQSLHFPLAEESPCARLYELKGHVLSIGCHLEDCTCLHLAEYRADCRPIKVEASCLNLHGERRWKRYLDLDIKKDEFNRIRQGMLQKEMIHSCQIGDCNIELFSASDAIDEMTNYLEKSSIYNLYR